MKKLYLLLLMILLSMTPAMAAVTPPSGMLSMASTNGPAWLANFSRSGNVFTIDSYTFAEQTSVVMTSTSNYNWNDVNQNRWNCDGDQNVESGTAISFTKSNNGCFVFPAGTYRIVMDFDNGTMTATGDDVYCIACYGLGEFNKYQAPEMEACNETKGDHTYTYKYDMTVDKGAWKIIKNHSWDKNWGLEDTWALNTMMQGGQDKGNFYAVTGTIYFDPVDGKVYVEGEQEYDYYIYGNLWAAGGSWSSSQKMTKQGDVYVLTQTTGDISGDYAGNFGIKVTNQGSTSQTGWIYNAGGGAAVTFGTPMNAVVEGSGTGGNWTGLKKNTKYTFTFDPEAMTLTVTITSPLQYTIRTSIFNTASSNLQDVVMTTTSDGKYEYTGTVARLASTNATFYFRTLRAGNQETAYYAETTSTQPVPVVFDEAMPVKVAGTSGNRQWTAGTTSNPIMKVGDKYTITFDPTALTVTVKHIVPEYYVRGNVNKWGGSGYSKDDYKFTYLESGVTKDSKTFHYRYEFDFNPEGTSSTQKGQFKIVGPNSWNGDSDCWGAQAPGTDPVTIKPTQSTRAYHRNTSGGNFNTNLLTGVMYFDPGVDDVGYIYISSLNENYEDPDPSNEDWWLRSTRNGWDPMDPTTNPEQDETKFKFTKLEEPVEFEGMEYWYVYEWNERTDDTQVKISSTPANTDDRNYGAQFTGSYNQENGLASYAAYEKVAPNTPFPLNASSYPGDAFYVRKGYEGKLYFQPVSEDEAWLYLEWDDSFKPDEHTYYLRGDINSWNAQNHPFMPLTETMQSEFDDQVYTHYITVRLNKEGDNEFKIVTENQRSKEDLNDRDTWGTDYPGRLHTRQSFLTSKLAGAGHNLTFDKLGWATIYFNPSTNYIYVDADDPAIPFYLSGDINEWQVVRDTDDKANKLYDDNGNQISRETYDEMWRFKPVTENDFISETGWYRLAIPATREGHKRLCGQFAINTGRWNNDGNGGNEYKANISANSKTLMTGIWHRMLGYIEDVKIDDSLTQAQKDEIISMTREKIQRILDGYNSRLPKNDDGSPNDDAVLYDENVTYDSDKAKIMAEYLDEHPIKAFNIRNLSEFDLGNDNLFYNAAHPVSNNNDYRVNMLLGENGIDNAVIYFHPGTLVDQANGEEVITDSKIIIFGTPVEQYIYYYAANKVENEDFKLYATLTTEDNAVNNYYLPYIKTIKTEFEKIVDGVSQTTGEEVGSLVYKNMTYPTYWRYRIPVGFEHRRAPIDGTVYTFTATITDNNGEEVSQEDLDCDNIYLMEDMQYHAYFRVDGADKYNGVKSVTVQVMRTNAAGTGLEAVNATRYPQLQGNLATKIVSVEGVNWRVPATSTNGDEIMIPGTLGQAYLVYTVTYNDNHTEYYYRPQDGNPKSRWIQMNGEDKYTIIYLNNRNIAIQRLFFSHLPGTYYTQRHSDVQVSVEAYIDGKRYTKNGTTGELEFQFAVGDDVDGAPDDSNLTYSQWSSRDSYTFDESNFDHNENDVKYIFARIRHKEHRDYTQTAYAAFPVRSKNDNELEDRFAFEQYDDSGTKFIEFFKKGECEGTHYKYDNDGNPVLDKDGNPVEIKKEDMPQHYLIRYSNVSDKYPNGRPVKVELIKYDNGQKQGYWHEDQGDGEGRFWIDVKDRIFMHNNNPSGEYNEIAFTCLNFGPVMYRIVVTPTDTTPAKVRTKAPTSRAADYNGYQDMEGKSAIAYNLYVANDNTTGVEEMEAVPAEYDGDAYYYNLQGIRVDNPAHGHIYIEVRGSEVRKVIL